MGQDGRTWDRTRDLSRVKRRRDSPPAATCERFGSPGAFTPREERPLGGVSRPTVSKRFPQPACLSSSARRGVESGKKALLDMDEYRGTAELAYGQHDSVHLKDEKAARRRHAQQRRGARYLAAAWSPTLATRRAGVPAV